MPNLVGIGNSQVPTNAMLGGLAYQDSVGEIVIDKIKAKTSDTAVDIFVYDTSKDSDGGAWRKKATKQSWYNENVSQRRGARKEFPAVAVIVVQSSYVTIYDGDDPNLPMWMEFTVNNSPGQIVFTNPTCTHMLNGLLVIGTNPNATNNDYWDGGIKLFNFISEDIRSYSGTRSMIYDMNISQRNDSTVLHYDTTNVLVSPNVSAVTMFVLPNAKTDVDTGIPIPTILAATRRGISVVRDSGVVYDMEVSVGGGSNYQTNSIEITKDLKIIHNWDDRASNAYSFISIIPLSLLESDSSYGYEYQFRNEGTYGYNAGSNSLDIFDTTSTYFVDAVPTELGYFAIGSNNGLVNIQHIPQSLNNGGRSGLGDARFNGGMHCRIANNFNTGWMFNNIKGAFLSDTVSTNITATTVTSNWATTGSWQYQSQKITLASDGAGGINITHADGGGSYVYSYLQFTAEANTDYMIQVDFSAYNSGDLEVVPAPYNSNNEKINLHGVSGLSKGGQFNSGSHTTLYLMINHNSTSTTTIKNIVVQKITEGVSDRSVRNKDLLLFGTINRDSVATGAELVSYGPFSTSNRLRQPYNSNLNFETNDFSVMLWMYNTGTDIHQTLVGRDNREFSVDILNNSSYDRKFRIYAFNSSNGLQTFDSNADPFPLNTWSHVCVNFTNGNTCSIYVNGVLNKTGSLNYDIDDTSNGLNIGCRNTSGSYAHAADGTKLALVRIAKSAPSAEQIKKIYFDERKLFAENAKCTLYGTSDAVTGLAFDDTNDVLHVGTSSGRSDFRGLNRINNTTTAVTTAIAASDGLVAEQ